MTDNKRVAMVTGAGSGIGLATAEAFAREGYTVALVDRDENSGQAAAESLADVGTCQFFRCDVSDEQSVNAAIDAIVDTFGRIDAAFNGAGISGIAAPTAECTTENWDNIMAVNLRGLWFCLKRQLQLMQQQGGGAIVNCASTQGLFGTYGLPAYVASKHGVVGLTKAAALEYVRDNIRINAVCPGMVNTPMWQRAVTPDVEQQLLATDPMGRLARPEEIAAAALWLCNPAASFITGHAMVVDGGMTAI